MSDYFVTLRQLFLYLANLFMALMVYGRLIALTVVWGSGDHNRKKMLDMHFSRSVGTFKE